MSALKKLPEYDWDEIRKHNNKSSLWIVIQDCVYDVTSFQEEHPGGEEVLLEQAGHDASAAFEDIGHSQEARELTDQYRIGVVAGGNPKVLKDVRSFSVLLSVKRKVAADQVTRKMPVYLSCPVCHGLYKKPKYLPKCFHSYCEECLVKLQEGSDLTCIVCEETSKVPLEGVKDFPSHSFLTRLADEMAIKQKIEQNESIPCDACIKGELATSFCFDCSNFQFHCKECFERHKYSTEKQGHRIIQLAEIRSEKKDVTLKQKSMQCQYHELDLMFYCETCDELACSYCTGKKHAGHEHESVKMMAKKHRSKIDDVTKPMDNIIVKLTKAQQNISSTREKIQSQATELEQEIDTYFDHLEQKLKQQRANLKKELHEVSTHKEKAVSLQLKQLENIQVQLENVKELGEAMKNGSDHEALFMNKQLAKDVERLSTICTKLSTEPVELANAKFSKEYEESFPFFGNLSYGDNSVFNTLIAYDVPAYGQVGKEVKFTIITKDDNHHPCQKGGSIQPKPRKGDVITAEVKDNQNGNYTASFVPTQLGEVEVTVTINGESISMCPLGVQVRIPQYTTLDKPSKIVNDDGKMGQPWGIAFDKYGVWAVIDRSNHCVCIFDSQNKLNKKFGSNGNGIGQLSSPCGLAFDANNHLYVADYSNHRVQKFDINGSYLLQFGNIGSSDGHLSSPVGITVYNDRVFVADQYNNRISVFQCDGQFSNSFGSGHLSNPYDVAVTNNNQVLVADWGHHCISIFTLDGNYVNKIGTQGSDRGQLSRPTSLAIDLYGFIFVTDGNYRVSIFDKDGVFIHCFGSSGSSAGQFSYPRGIACSPNGSVYVCDQDNKRIQIFSDY